MDIQMHNLAEEGNKKGILYLYDEVRVHNDANCVGRPEPSSYYLCCHRYRHNVDECLKEIVN